ncbi:MAG: hypothetical protein BroJett040_17690 [Oligoflexia bacterium]|nr:MAG: hypothetical protein BroJett040_17690 [Oligoflexia bacterium]
MRSPIILRIFKGPQLVEVKQFDQEQIIVGHDGDVQVDLKDPSVSPIHCLIELRDSGYFLCDLGSQSGTHKNGAAILDEPLSSGDQIGIGPFQIHFFVGVPKPKAPPVVEVPQPVQKVSPLAQSISQPVQTEAKVVEVAKVSPPPQIPEVGKVVKKSTTQSAGIRHDKTWNTFAPSSEISDLKGYLRPTKGTVVEVIVAWKERVLSIQHFSEKKSYTIGSQGCDVEIPPTFISGKLPFVDYSNGCRVVVTQNMYAELKTVQDIYKIDDLQKMGRLAKISTGTAIRVEQAELLCITIGDGTLQIFVRFVPASEKPTLVGLDISAGELTGLIVTFVLVSLLAIYMSIYGPQAIQEPKQDETLRLAQFVYNKKEEPPKPPEPPKPEPKKVEAKDVPPPEPKKVEVTDKKTGPKGPAPKPAVKEQPATKAAEVRPMPSQVNKPKKFTSIKQGGSVKVGETEGANAQSARDVSKTGLLSAFGGGGSRTQLDQAYSGSGELLGMADKATGTSGQSTNRAGEDIGSKFKDAGAGGKGTATQGIAGVGTKGRSSGQSAYGGEGLGGKGSVAIEAGGIGEEFVGSIDREAVRRVIRSILAQIKSCYERQLRMTSDLEGKIVINFDIHEQGRVKSAKPKETSAAMRPVAECVASRIKEQRFPEPPAGSYASVDYPFVFGAQK